MKQQLCISCEAIVVRQRHIQIGRIGTEPQTFLMHIRAITSGVFVNAPPYPFSPLILIFASSLLAVPTYIMAQDKEHLILPFTCVCYVGLNRNTL